MTMREGLDLGEPFGIVVARDGDVVTVAVAGELDIDTVPKLEAALEDPPAGGRLVLDLRTCTFMDSSGVRVLMSLDVRAREQNFGFVIARSSGPIQRLLDLCQVSSRVTTVDAPG